MHKRTTARKWLHIGLRLGCHFFTWRVLICKHFCQVKLKSIHAVHSYGLDINSCILTFKNCSIKIKINGWILMRLTFKKQRVGQSFYVLTSFLFFNLSSWHCHYLSFIIINGNLLKYVTVTAKLLQRKLWIISLLSCKCNNDLWHRGMVLSR